MQKRVGQIIFFLSASECIIFLEKIESVLREKLDKKRGKPYFFVKNLFFFYIAHRGEFSQRVMREK